MNKKMVNTKTRTATAVGITVLAVGSAVFGISYYGGLRPVETSNRGCPTCPVCSESSSNASVIKEINCKSSDSKSGTDVTAYVSGEKLSDGTYRIKAWGGGFLKLTVSASGAPKNGDQSKTETVTGKKTFTCDAESKEINFEKAGPGYNGISTYCTSGIIVSGSVLNIFPYGSGRIEGMIYKNIGAGGKPEGKAILRVKFYTAGYGTITGAPTCVNETELE
jgi:hypothetical protein